jgi:hypothetical protein
MQLLGSLNLNSEHPCFPITLDEEVMICREGVGDGANGYRISLVKANDFLVKWVFRRKPRIV